MFYDFILLNNLFSAKKFIPLHYMTNSLQDIQPVISFIITDYNLPIQLLRECIESIISLDIKPEQREIILVNDGSEISPEPELNDLSSYIRFIHQENKGLSEARNEGIRMSKGQYIQFVDGDDYLLSNYNDCFRSILQNSYDMLFFDCVSKKATSFPGKIKTLGSGIEYMLHNNLHASAWGYIFKKELLGDDLRFTKGIVHEDEEFTPLLTLRAKNLARYSGSAYFYRVREGSIVHSNDKEHLRRRINDFIGVISSLNTKADMLEGDEKRALKRRVDQTTMDLIYNIIRLTHSKEDMNNALSELRKKGGNPLPIKLYTGKYLIFSMLISIYESISHHTSL